MLYRWIDRYSEREITRRMYTHNAHQQDAVLMELIDGLLKAEEVRALLKKLCNVAHTSGERCVWGGGSGATSRTPPVGEGNGERGGNVAHTSCVCVCVCVRQRH